MTELHHALRDKPVMANKVVETLSRIYNAAEDRGLIPEASNPCGLVVKNRERKRERFLTPDEFRRLGRALREVTGCRRVSPYSVAAIRLLILTGCRKREILHLRWEQVDLEAAELRLPDTKTGPRRVALSPRAVGVLEGIARLTDSPWVIPGMVAGRPMRNIDEAWGVVCELAGLEDTRIHDCRHSFRVPCAGARREPADDRAPARAFGGADDGALCASRPGLGPGGGDTHLGEPRGRCADGVSGAAGHGAGGSPRRGGGRRAARRSPQFGRLPPQYGGRNNAIDR